MPAQRVRPGWARVGVRKPSGEETAVSRLSGSEDAGLWGYRAGAGPWAARRTAGDDAVTVGRQRIERPAARERGRLVLAGGGEQTLCARAVAIKCDRDAILSWLGLSQAPTKA